MILRGKQRDLAGFLFYRKNVGEFARISVNLAKMQNLGLGSAKMRNSEAANLNFGVLRRGQTIGTYTLKSETKFQEIPGGCHDQNVEIWTLRKS